MKSIDDMVRGPLLSIFAALGALNPAASSASDCKLVNAALQATTRVCVQSPVGICSSGTIESGLLAGEFSTTHDAVAPGAGLGTLAPHTVAYSASVTATTADGELHLHQLGVSDPDNKSFIELLVVTDGNGRFTGASGVLHVTGNLDTHEIATRMRGKISGRICLERP